MSNAGKARTIATSLQRISVTSSKAAMLLNTQKSNMIGAQARVEVTRDKITAIYEELDAIEHELYDLQTSLLSCVHPQESWIQEGAWVCGCCGSVWSGLQWQTHSAQPTDRD